MAYQRKGYRKGYNKGYRSQEVKPVVRVQKKWSNLQKAIFEEIANGTGNLNVDALAGTGKTSTIVEGFYHVPQDKSVLMVAFNKSIQIELKNKAPSNVDVFTLHALGLKAITKAFGKIEVDKIKLEGYIRASIGDETETLELRKNLSKAVSLSKGYLADTSEKIKEVFLKHDVDFCDKSEDEFIVLVLKLMEDTKKDTARIDFDDMIWFPAVYNLNPQKYDFVFVDEAQDLNLAQIDLALRSVQANGRIISVGDEFQAIYQFRGADENAVQNIIDRLNSKRLPLSVTYRCGKSIVREAQQYVPEYEAYKDNPEGHVEYTNLDKMKREAKAGDFILSRVNAPLIKLCMYFLKDNRKANIQGRDIGKNLLWMIKKSKAKDVVELLQWVQEWRYRECEKYAKLNRTNIVEIISDKAEMIENLCEGAIDLKEVKSNIERLFHDGDDDKDRIILSSIHKSKGLERDRVWVLINTLRLNSNKEETNLAYVAITRAISSLYYVKTK